LRLTIKYPLTIITMALAAALVTGLVAYQISEKELRLAAERQSIEILESRKAALSRYLKSIEQDLALMATNRTVQEALGEFTAGWSTIDGRPQDRLRTLYVDKNPHPSNAHEDLDQADDGSAYSRTHGRFHSWFRQYIEERSYHDIYLFDTKGNLVYTVLKEADYATNLENGRWHRTDLGHAFRTTSFNKFPGFQAYYDFKAYPPRQNEPASFLATPVFDSDENYLGVLAFQMQLDPMDEIMQVSAGMGKAGRVYLVGLDLLIRNDPKFPKASEVLKAGDPTEFVNLALEGVAGAREITGAKGDEVLIAYTSVSFAGQAWAIISEFDLIEVLAPVTEMRRVMIWAGLFIGLLVTIVGVWFAGGLSRPIVTMTNIMQRLAERDLDVEVPASGRADEIGAMEKTLVVFKENAVERQRAEEELSQANEELQELNELKNKFMGMAAHDLRNPLGAIRGMSQLIVDLDLGEEKEKEFILSINEVSDQMLELLNDLLDVSAIESGNFDLNWQAADIGELLKNRIELVSYSAEAKGISISAKIDDIPFIEFDSARINQVVDNLLTNAVKFSPPDSVIDTEVRLQDTTIDVVVRDHGQGIPAHEINKVFTAFEKLSAKPTAGEKSTGLGLAIVKRIVDAHGGTIGVESVSSEGTTFTVSLLRRPNKNTAEQSDG